MNGPHIVYGDHFLIMHFSVNLLLKILYNGSSRGINK